MRREKEKGTWSTLGRQCVVVSGFWIVCTASLSVSAEENSSPVGAPKLSACQSAFLEPDQAFLKFITVSYQAGNLTTDDLEATAQNLRNGQVINPLEKKSLSGAASGSKRGLESVTPLLQKNAAPEKLLSLAQKIELLIVEKKHIEHEKSVVSRAQKDILSPHLIRKETYHSYDNQRVVMRKTGLPAAIFVTTAQTVLRIVNMASPHQPLDIPVNKKVLEFSNLLVTPDGRELLLLLHPDNQFSIVDLAKPEQSEILDGIPTRTSQRPVLFMPSNGHLHVVLHNSKFIQFHVLDLQTRREKIIDVRMSHDSVPQFVSVDSKHEYLALGTGDKGLLFVRIEKELSAKARIRKILPPAEGGDYPGKYDYFSPLRLYQSREGKKYLFFYHNPINHFGLSMNRTLALFELDLSQLSKTGKSVPKILTSFLVESLPSSPPEIFDAGADDWVILPPQRDAKRIFRITEEENPTTSLLLGDLENSENGFTAAFFRDHRGTRRVARELKGGTVLIETLDKNHPLPVEWKPPPSSSAVLRGVAVGRREDGTLTTYALTRNTDNDIFIFDIFARPAASEVAE